jgi:V8-like Glu-specific endopeptidase
LIIQGRFRFRRPTTKVLTGTVPATCLCAAAALVTGSTVQASVSSPTGNPDPDRGVARVIGRATQQATRAYWTPARMESATPEQFGRTDVSSSGAPRGTPTATHFNGVPTIGALFYTTGKKTHFCTASVIASSAGDLILTAAHCVYSKGYKTNIEFVPEYHSGHSPYGAWPVQTITIAEAWKNGSNPGFDFAFLAVTPPSGTSRPIQKVTGALSLGINEGYAHPIEVVGYNDTDSQPVRCLTKSFKFSATQMEFYCHDYKTGTSGGPWIRGYHAPQGTGTVYGDIGGYEQGGDYEWASYSPYFGSQVQDVFEQAEQKAPAAAATTRPAHLARQDPRMSPDASPHPATRRA